MPQLTPSELEAFLDEPGHLLRIATIDADGLPRSVPIWFIRENDQIVFNPARPIGVLRQHQARPACRSFDRRSRAPVPQAERTGLGHHAVRARAGRRLARPVPQIAYRYVDRESADSYVDTTIDQPRALLALPFAGREVKVSTWRMPIGDEDPTGIWHSRYYAQP